MNLKVFKEYFRNLRKVFEVKVDSWEFNSRRNFKQIRCIICDCQVHLDFSLRSQYFFSLEFTPCKSEQLLGAMEYKKIKANKKSV